MCSPYKLPHIMNDFSKFDPKKHLRKSIRLKGYDYTQCGKYFVTICSQYHDCLFGGIKNGKMILNDAGKMIKKWYLELPNRFQDIKCGEYVIMPNHFHAIIINSGNHVEVSNNYHENKQMDNRFDEDGKNLLGKNRNNRLDEHEKSKLGEHIGSPLHKVIGWFKTMTTNEYIRGVKQLGWEPFNGKLWQRNYHEHIIRNKDSYLTIKNYIMNNPKNWDSDKYFQ